MIRSERSRSRPPATRATTWLLLVALGAGCTSPSAPDEPVPPAGPVLGDAAGDDAAGVAEVADPTVPSFGTAADRLEAAVVQLEPAGADAADTAVRVDVRVAAHPEDRARGLMGVPELPDGSGMLFVYTDDRTGGFWMKNTLVPLDIAFLAPDGTVRAVLTMDPCTADPCPGYHPEVAYRAALEVPAGWFAANGIGVGAAVSWSEPVPAEPVSADLGGQ